MRFDLTENTRKRGRMACIQAGKNWNEMLKDGGIHDGEGVLKQAEQDHRANRYLSARGPASHCLFPSVKHSRIEPKLLEALGAHLHSAAWSARMEI